MPVALEVAWGLPARMSSVIAYQADAWHDLLVMAGGASAALAGLLFVAVSLNHEQILQVASLPTLAAQSITVLIGLVVLCLLGLTPGQSSMVLGGEVLVLAVALGMVVLVPTVRGLSAVSEFRWKVARMVISLLSTVPMLVTGASLLLGRGGGLFWALFTIISGLAVATYNAWILLIEIRR